MSHVAQRAPRARSVRRLIAAAVAAVPLLGFGIQSANAATLFWSGDGTAQGGVGTWNTALARFGTVAAGPYTTVWNNTNVDSVVLDSTPGAITTGAALTVNTITANTSTTSATTSWLIGNSTTAATNQITFSGANAGINANFSTGTIFLRNAAKGELIKTGTGRLELDNTMMAITKYTLQAGAITVPAVSRLGAAPGALDQDFFVFDGGGFGAAVATADLGTTRGVTIEDGGAFFGGSAAANVITVGAPIVGTAGGNLTVTGGGPFYSPMSAGVTLLLTNAGNSWDGNAVLNGASGSKIQAGASNVIPNTAIIQVLAAGNTFELQNFSDTVKSISGTAGTIALGTGTLTLNAPNGESFAGVLTAGNAGKLVKNGAGAISLSGSSTGYAGETVLNNGTIGIGGANSLGSGVGAKLTINGGKLSNTANTGRSMAAALAVNMDGDFTVDDSIFATQGQINFQGTNTIRLSNRTITVSGTANLAFGGAVGQDVAGRSLTKDGNGILALNNAANTYSGDTTILNGSLSVDGDGSLGTGAGNLNLSGGKLNISASRTATITNPINLTADSAITFSSNANTPIVEFTSTLGGAVGTLTLRDEAGDATTDLFRVRFSGSGFDFTRPIVIVDNGALGKAELASFNITPTSHTFSGNISGGGIYRRSASAGNGGETVFTGDNSYTGGTFVNSGTLVANSSSGQALGGTTAIEITGGGTLRLGAANQINDAANMLLDGGKFETNDVDESLATLDVDNSSVVDLGNIDSILAFADSSGVAWGTGTLSIWNWNGDQTLGGGADQVHFGTLPLGGLTPAQLALINFYSDAGSSPIGTGGAQFVGTSGEVVPVPEPTGIALLALGSMSLLARRRQAR